jgi:uncharacterized protein involved in outer membrane biogenesis
MSPERGGVGLKLLVFLAVVFAAGALAWMLFLPLVFTTQVRQRTGFDITVQSLAVNPFTGTIELRGLVLANPPTFPVRDFVELRRFSAEVEVLTLFSARPVLATMALDVAKVTLVKRPAAETNAESFQRHLTQADDPPLPLPARPARGFLIRRLEVRIDELVIADYSARIPAVQRYKLAFNQTYMDVTSVRQLLAPAALQGLLPVGTALNGLLPGALGQALGEVVKEATKSGAGLLKDAGRKAGEKIKGYFDALEESRKP